jgi:hypothetical protein
MKILLFFCLALVGCTGLSASSSQYHTSSTTPTVYYVSPNGNDANNGTSRSTAWKTVAKVNASSFKAGESILFEGGETFAGTLSFSASSWQAASANPVIIGSYGTGRATINSGTDSGFYAHNVSGFVLRDLIFIAGSGNATSGVSLLNDLSGNTKLDYVVLTNLDVSGYGADGIVVDGENGSAGFTNITISNSVTHHNTGNLVTAWGSAGIHAKSDVNYGFGATQPSHSNVMVDHCTSHSNPGTAGSTNWTGSGIMLASVANSTIQFSLAYNNGAASFGTVGIWTADSTGVLIQYNEAHHTMTVDGRDGDGFDLDGGVTNSVLQYNYSHDNMGAGYLLYTYADANVNATKNITARFNISENDVAYPNGTLGSIFIGNDGGTLTGVNVYNNTIYLNSAPMGAAIAYGGSSATTITGHVANNILYVNNGTKLINLSYGNGSPSGLLFSGNDYYSPSGYSLTWGGITYSSLGAWQAATGQEMLSGASVGLTVNPMLVNPGGGSIAYQLQAGSPLASAGLNLLGLFGIDIGKTDFFGSALATGSFAVGASRTLKKVGW